MSSGEVAARLAEQEYMGDFNHFSPGSGIDQTCGAYDTDYSLQDWGISFSELLRIIHFYNICRYNYCPTSCTEDGYRLGL